MNLAAHLLIQRGGRSWIWEIKLIKVKNCADGAQKEILKEKQMDNAGKVVGFLRFSTF